ncbi:lipoate--protein ligase family protein [Neomoorella thermoacetica]|uniref:lipoate--protein ligase family protein n=1 Tax=Neomoorella thermoacetica TaxID=1525 RepID=UPI0008FAB57C|nr:lipoate--protein ligase family protein [Moorella thermoacetica]OIQ12323.1 octanoyltransferase LipM [Moorella thermoacetica]
MPAETWRLLDTGVSDPYTNMAIDEAILLEHREGKTPPTLRFYAWSPPTISLGYFQQLEKEIDLEAVKERGLGLVRRLTGGRAVLHDDEVTYSVVAREDHPLMIGGIRPSYLRLAKALAAGLRELGAPVEIASGRKGGREEHTTAACFDAPSWYEITCGGRKLVGSAQTRKGGVVLQHGSIVLTLNGDDLFAVLKMPSEAVRQRLLAKFYHQACGLEEVLGRRVEAGVVKENIVRAFTRLYAVEFVPGGLTEGEKGRLKELRAKYAAADWLKRR